MNRKAMLFLVLVGVLVVTVGAASAQGGGGRGGPAGPGGQNGQQIPCGTCDLQTQQQAQNRYGRSDDWAGGPQQNRLTLGQFGGLPAGVVDELPQAIIDLMIQGWLDEQHAYAVYDAVIASIGAVNPFVNIQRAEAQHSAAWEALFARYGIGTPAVPAFDLPTVASLTEACQIAAEAEVANFGLYDTMLAAFEPYPDLAWVTRNLRDVSEFNHLPAFERCAAL